MMMMMMMMMMICDDDDGKAELVQNLKEEEEDTIIILSYISERSITATRCVFASVCLSVCLQERFYTTCVSLVW